MVLIVNSHQSAAGSGRMKHTVPYNSHIGSISISENEPSIETTLPSDPN